MEQRWSAGELPKDDSPLELFEDGAKMTIGLFYDST